jgi:O-antigen/teichoic acid export membrane protein
VNMSAAQAIVLACAFANSVVLARYLGPRGRGVLAVAWLVPGLIQSLGDIGLTDAVVYYASDTRRARSVRNRTIWSCAILGGVYTGLIWAFASALVASVVRGVPQALVALAAVAITPEFLRNNLTSYLLARGASRLYSIMLVMLSGVTLLFQVFALVVFHGGVVGASLAMVLATSVMAVAAVVAALRLTPARRQDDKLVPIRELAAYGWKVFVGNIAQKLNYRLDLFFVNYFSGSTGAGYYTLSARLAEIPLVIPRSVRLAWFSQSARESRTSSVDGLRGRTDALSKRLQRLLVIGLPIYGAIAALCVPLVYGRDFAPAVVPMLLLLPGVLALSVSMARVGALNGVGRPDVVRSASWWALVVTVALDVVLIPWLGLAGAAIASSLAYGVYALRVNSGWRRLARQSAGD